jgi:diadenosine tetraphosphate (Ap4A) HIT family hydrolase
MSPFTIHPRLLADCHYLGKLTHCHVLLNKNALIPWLILVPEEDVADLLDAPANRREQILDECAEISRWIKQHYAIQKINFGAIGNVVPQLHLHVVGRKTNDACWPKPVWDNLDRHKDYSSDEIKSIRQQLVANHHLIAEDDPGC